MKEKKVFYSDSGQLFYDIDEAQINDNMAVLQKEIQTLYDKITALQDRCSHNHMTISLHSDTGNWCISDDSYWYEGTCRACGARFKYEQSEDSILRTRHLALGSDPRIEKK